MYSLWEDNTLHLQYAPIKHLVTSFFPTFFSPKGKQFKKFYRCAQDFIDVQSHQVSLHIIVNRGLTKETSLPAHSYFAPPVLATARQETHEFSFDLPSHFLQPTCSYTRHPDLLLRALWTFPPSLFLNCILSRQFLLSKSRQDSSPHCQNRHFQNREDTARKHVDLTSTPSRLNTVIILLTCSKAGSSTKAVQPDRHLAQQPSVTRGPAKLCIVSQITEWPFHLCANL